MDSTWEVLVIGGAVLDVVFSATDSTTAASSMAGTSTPCKLARMTLGGVGRNIAEALTRLGVKLHFRTVIGSAPTLSPQGANAVDADGNGSVIIEGLRSLTRDYPNFTFSPALIRGASTATYLAILDSKGELVAAAAAMDIFEKHFTLDMALHGLRSMPTLRPKWVVLDGNLPKTTLEGICKFMSSVTPLTGINRSGPRIAYDPISKEKVLRAIDCLKWISLMKPNNFESIALAVELARGATPKVNVKEVKHSVDSVIASIQKILVQYLAGWPSDNTTLMSNTKSGSVAAGSIPAQAAREAFITIVEIITSSPTSAANLAVLWTALERMSLEEQELVALLATVYIVNVGKVGHVLCTLGKGGCWSVTPQHDNVSMCSVRRIPSIPIPPNELVKVTGAGDSFLSGYIFGLLQKDCTVRDNDGWRVEERYATRAAAAALTSQHSTINPHMHRLVVGKGKL